MLELAGPLSNFWHEALTSVLSRAARTAEPFSAGEIDDVSRLLSIQSIVLTGSTKAMKSSQRIALLATRIWRQRSGSRPS